MTTLLPPVRTREIVKINGIDRPVRTEAEDKIYEFIKNCPNRTIEDVALYFHLDDLEYIYQATQFLIAYGWVTQDITTFALNVDELCNN